MTLVQRILTEKRKLVTVVALILVVDLVIYGLAVAPWANRVVQADAETAEAEALLFEARRNHQSAARKTEIKQEGDRELQRFYREVLPQGLPEARALLSPFVDRVADDTGLVVERRSNLLERETDSVLGRLSTTVVLSGEYEDIRRFVFALETSPEFIVIEEIVLSQAEQSRRGLVLTLSAATYFWEGTGV